MRDIRDKHKLTSHVQLYLNALKANVITNPEQHTNSMIEAPDDNVGNFQLCHELLNCGNQVAPEKEINWTVRNWAVLKMSRYISYDGLINGYSVM